MGHEAFANIIPSSLSISMTTVKSKTDRVTFISQKSDWLGLGPIKEVKMNKTLDVVQFYFEDGSIGEVHACNSGGLVLSPIVNVDSGLKALDVPRLVRAPDSEGDSIGSGPTPYPINTCMSATEPETEIWMQESSPSRFVPDTQIVHGNLAKPIQEESLKTLEELSERLRESCPQQTD